MQKRLEKKMGIRCVPLLTAIGIAGIAVGLLTESAAIAEGIRKGLEICGGVLIPSLFPFMVLSSFLLYTDYARILSLPLRPVTTHLLKLPEELGIVVLLGLVGGYPVGAKMIANLLEQKQVDQKTAERMLCFCVNAGPSFVITAVGAGLFLDKAAGVILFASQTFATLLIGWFVSRRATQPLSNVRQGGRVHPGPALVLAVQGATSAMLAMCAFAVLFAGLLAMLGSVGVVENIAAVLPVGEATVQAVVSGFLEVTSGCIAASRLEGGLSFALTSAIISFSGLSVLFQIISCFGSRPLRFRPLVVSRIAHAGVSTIVAVPLYRQLCGGRSVWLAQQAPLMHSDSRTALISVCLLGMCAIFTLSLEEMGSSKK